MVERVVDSEEPARGLAGAAAEARSGNWPLIFLLGVLTALAPFSTDMYLPALPRVAADLRATLADVQNTVSIFFFGMAIGQLFHGPLSDRWGRKPIMAAGLAAYVVASIGCALADSSLQLTVWRLVQAIGGCAGVVIARAVARDRFEQHETLRILALLVIVMCVSPIIAPFCGAWMLSAIDWRAIFVAQAGVALVLFICVLGLRESRPPAARDLAKRENPLKGYAYLLRQRPVRHYLVAGCAPAAGAYGWVASSATIVIQIYGSAPAALGMVFAANAAGMVIGNLANIRLTRRWSSDRVMAIANYAGLAVASLLLAIAWTGAGGLIGFLAPIFVVVATLGMTQGNAMVGALREHPLRAGSLSALMGSGMYFAGSMAAALVAWLGQGAPRAVATLIFVTSALAAANSAGLLGSRPEPPPRS